MDTQVSSPFARLGAVALLVLLAGCESVPESHNPAEVTEEATSEAAVIAVDRATRAVTLERADGKRMTLTCGPEVRNFDRINVGDKVKALWRMTIAVRRLRPDEPDTAPSVIAAATRAPEGGEPAAGVAAGVTLTVKVESVDMANHVVVVIDPDGIRRTVKAQRDQGKRFVEGLKSGDRVEIIHREGIALAVE